MGGALLELLAVGEQDVHLTNNPQFSYFKSVYRRHTNFAIESIPQYFKENPDFGQKVSCIIEKKGDLLHQIFLEIHLPSLMENVSWVNSIGTNIIKKIDLLIGGIEICSMRGEYLDIHHELTTDGGKRSAYYKMVGKLSSYTRNSQTESLKLIVPIPFWFCKEIHNALPIIAMQYSEIRINVDFRPFNECWYSGTSMSITPETKTITNATLYCDYIYLDRHERIKTATQESCEYLIEQVQIEEGNNIAGNITDAIIHFNFNHPVKELLWLYQANSIRDTNDWSNYSKILDDDTQIQSKTAPLDYITYKMNGLERFQRRFADYFRLVVPFQRHTSVNSDSFIYTYSFSIYPEKHQPSGSCNFSKIDNNQLLLELEPNVPAGQIRIYAINYNLIKIKNGMTGLAYS